MARASYTSASAVSVSKMKDLFNKYDEDKDGTISRDELESILQKLIPDLTRIEFDRMFRMIDKNHNLLVEYDEFVDAVYGTYEPNKPKFSCHVSQDSVDVLFVLWHSITQDKQPGVLMSREKLLSELHKTSEIITAAEAKVRESSDDPIASLRLLSRMCGSDMRSRLGSLPEEITQKQYVQAVWPKLKQADVEFTLRYMRRCLARLNLGKVMKCVVKGSSMDLDAEDVAFAFRELDVDGDGLEIKEMVRGGAITSMEAIELSEKLDQVSEDGKLSLKEFMGAVTSSVNSDFSQSLRATFATGSR